MAHKAHKNTKKTGTITAKVTPTSKCSGGTKKSTLKKGTKVTIVGEGIDEVEAVDTIAEFIASDIDVDKLYRIKKEENK